MYDFALLGLKCFRVDAVTPDDVWPNRSLGSDVDTDSVASVERLLGPGCSTSVLLGNSPGDVVREGRPLAERGDMIDGSLA
jgi:hypothetical protein